MGARRDGATGAARAEDGGDVARDWVLHVDMDQFLVAVELLRRPELVGRPVVVGGRGDPTERAVVATASYEARAYGVRSGLPLKLAVRRCPEAVFLPVDQPVYQAASEQVMAALRGMPGAAVEVLGWDEAFVGTRCVDPHVAARAAQQAVREATALPCSVGIGDTVVRAKMATGFGKPGGVFALTEATWQAVLGDEPATVLWGVGARIGQRLAALGVHTVRDLGRAGDAVLAAEFGPTNGPRLGRLGRGEGRRRVDPSVWVPRGHGHETTYQQDLVDPLQVRAALRELAGRVAADLRREGRPAARVHLKARFAPFFTVTRARKLPAATDDADVLAEAAHALFAALQDDRPVRLLGIRAEMEPPPGGY